MVIRLGTPFERLLASVLAIFFSIALAWALLQPWRAQWPVRKVVSPESLRQALRCDPGNPEYHFLLAQILHYHILEPNYPEALEHYRKALYLNRMDSRSWFELGRLYHKLARPAESDRATALAVRFAPKDVFLRWDVAAFQLQNGNLSKALENLRYIITHIGVRRIHVYALVRRILPADYILEQFIPRDYEILVEYFSFLISQEEAEDAIAAWNHLFEFKDKLDPYLQVRYINFMISKSRIHEAQRAWHYLVRGMAGTDAMTRGNLIWNGDFEVEGTPGGGFDWRIGRIRGAEISLDPVVSKEGKRSLKIAFDGKYDVDFSHVWQLVPVKSNTEYFLQGYVKSKDLITTSDLKIQVLEFGSETLLAATPLMARAHDWAKLTIAFKTAAQTKAIVLKVRREPMPQRGGVISGTIWIDDISMREVPSLASKAQW